MFYCEKCNLKNEEEVCLRCGKNNLRQIKNEDFCYFITLNNFDTNYFELNLNEQNIPVAKLGIGYNYTTKTSNNYRIFIPYKDLTKAEELYNLLFK